MPLGRKGKALIKKAATKPLKDAKKRTKSLAKRGALGLEGKIASKLFGGRSKKSKIMRAARKKAGAKKGSGVGRAALQKHRADKRAAKAAKRAGPAPKAAPKKVMRKKRPARKRPVSRTAGMRGKARAAANRGRR
jgi:hypothetical protein